MIEIFSSLSNCITPTYHDVGSSRLVQGFAGLYDNLFMETLLNRNLKEEELNFLLKYLNLEKGSSILDQGCGIGSVSIPLMKMGYLVTGVDIVADYVDYARKWAQSLALPADFYCGDCTHFFAPHAFDAVISWWTSWGHGESDKDNLAILQSAQNSLKPGGRYILDWMNLPSILANFKPVVTNSKNIERLGGVVHTIRECRIDLQGGWIHTNWIYNLPNGIKTSRTTKMRMYMPDQIYSMLKTAGFKEIQLLGDRNGSPLEINHHRMIALATKGME